MTDGNRKRFSLLQLELKPGRGLLITLGIMAMLIAGVTCFGIPNPNMILIAGLVVCSALFGYEGGIAATAVMVLFTLYFFSTGNDFVTFTPENAKKVFVSLLGILADMLFVCELKRHELKQFREIRRLTDALREDNQLLQQASMTDELTGLRNRFALRRDYPEYLNQDVFVMMLDVDDFKTINDEYGHDKGDFILSETGKLLSDTFGSDNCYRFGGDEFLVILPDAGETVFKEKLRWLIAQRPFLEADGGRARPGYSIGYVHGRVAHEGDLRDMFNAADEIMYRNKRERRSAV